MGESGRPRGKGGREKDGKDDLVGQREHVAGRRRKNQGFRGIKKIKAININLGGGQHPKERTHRNEGEGKEDRVDK